MVVPRRPRSPPEADNGVLLQLNSISWTRGPPGSSPARGTRMRPATCLTTKHEEPARRRAPASKLELAAAAKRRGRPSRTAGERETQRAAGSARTPRRRSAAGRRPSARALGRLLCAVRTGARAGVGMLVNKWGWTGWPMGSIIFMCLWAKFNHYVAVGSMCFCPQGWKTKLGTISGSCVGVFNYTNT